MLQKTINFIILLGLPIYIADCFAIQQKQPIVILCTGALISQKFEERKTEYITVLNILNRQPLPVFFVESCTVENFSYLNDYCEHVFYSHSNNFSLKNKGVNEAKAMIKALEYFNFDDDSLIIKLTGRYPFNNFDFINLILNNQSYDAFIKCDSQGQVYTGCFAMRCKHMKNMIAQLNLVGMEKHMINIEAEVARYINKNILSHTIYPVSSLGITARFFGNGGILDIQEL